MWGPSSPCNIKTILSIGTKRRKAENENDYFVCWSPLGESPYQPPPRWPRRAGLSFSFFQKNFQLRIQPVCSSTPCYIWCSIGFHVFQPTVNTGSKIQSTNVLFQVKVLTGDKISQCSHSATKKSLFRASIFLKLPTLCSLFFSSTWARCSSENQGAIKAKQITPLLGNIFLLFGIGMNRLMG